MDTKVVANLSHDPEDIQIEMLVKQWYTAIAPWSFSAYANRDIRQRLYELARQAQHLLFTADVRTDQARPLGAALVEMHYNQPEVLEQTLLVLEQHLRTLWTDSDQATLNRRLPVLLAGIAAGFVQQMRQAILSEQETFQRATLTARSRAEEELRASEERLRIVLNNHPIGMITIDQEGYINLIAGQVHKDIGINVDRMIGKSFVDTFSQFNVSMQAYHRACAGESSRWNQTYDAHIYDLIFNPLRDGTGQIVGVIALAIDITQRMQAQLALEQERANLEIRVRERTLALEQSNAELKRLNQVKDDFLAMMSHELRTPLHAILILSESLRFDVYGTLSEAQAHRLQQIEQNTQHLKTMLSDILDLTKIGAGKLELDLKPVDLREICLTALKLIEQSAHTKNIVLAASLDPDVTTIVTDARRLKQILLNLLDNAIKFTNAGGTIGLQVIGNKDNRTVECIVWDTGIGIAEEDISRLFQPFVQLDSRLSRKYEGTGLGLVLVYRLAELLGGYADVMSELEHGSRFTVTLPWRTSDTPAKPTEKSIPPPQPQRILSDQTADQPGIVLAEDDTISAVLLCDFLTMRGYKVVIARNGIEAIEYTRTTRPDLVVMDIHMPEMDGLEAIQQIRSIPDLAHTPIIAMTAMAMHGDEDRCIDAGANEYVSKPVSLHKLAEVIEKIRHIART